MTNDLDRIREDTWSVETTSLNVMGAEPVPVEIIRDLFKTEWNDEGERIPMPQIHVKNDITHPNQAALNTSDWCLIDMVSYEEKQRGFTYEFKDIEIAIIVEIYTIKSRQRLYDLMAQFREIIYRNNRTVRPYQLIYWDGFDEDSDGRNRNWYGECHFRLTSEGVPVFKGVVAGMGSENLPEDQR